MSGKQMGQAVTSKNDKKKETVGLQNVGAGCNRPKNDSFTITTRY
jgi:hypothetical protein